MSFRRRRPDDWATSHARARTALSDRLDELLEPSESRWLDDHLVGCAECRAVAADYDQQRSALRALAAVQPTPPRDLWARTAAAIERESAGRQRRPTRSSRNVLLRSPLLPTALVVIVAAGTLISSRLLGGGVTTTPGSSVVTALASEGGGTLPPAATPIAVAERVQFISQDREGRFRVTSWDVHAVCPNGVISCPSGAPVEDQPVQIQTKPESVFGSSDGRRLIVISHTATDTSSVSVVPVPTATPEASATPEATATATAVSSPTATITVSPSASATSSTRPSSTPTETPPASPTPTPKASASGGPTASPPGSELPSTSPTIPVTPSASPDGSIQIADNVVLVGQSAAYSPSGTWFAFTARPSDGTTGPDIYLWKVGDPAARAVTTDHASVFGSWVGEVAVGSTVSTTSDGDAASAMPSSAMPSSAPAGSDAADAAIVGTSFLLDPTTGNRIDIVRGRRTWRPTVDPSGHRAVYWTGSLRLAGDAPVFVPAAGRLVIGDWSTSDPSASAGTATGSAAPDDGSARHETTIASGRVDDWDARWDSTGTKLAVWIADPDNAQVGTLSLYSLDPFDGRIDLKKPLLDGTPATAGFSMSDGKLVWAEPSTDGSGSGNVLVLAWTDKGAGTVQTLSDEAVVIR
jgi:hypothetical protein